MRHTLLILLAHWSLHSSGTADECGYAEAGSSLRSLRSLARRASDWDMRCSPWSHRAMHVAFSTGVVRRVVSDAAAASGRHRRVPPSHLGTEGVGGSSHEWCRRGWILVKACAPLSVRSARDERAPVVQRWSLRSGRSRSGQRHERCAVRDGLVLRWARHPKAPRTAARASVEEGRPPSRANAAASG
jgi:hypothetical protein